ncbi:MAG: hypothetical protein LBN95_07065 [Prevotellaceae bacterium]|nr:hypothetical protein [Prevotellaceae bacterium]
MYSKEIADGNTAQTELFKANVTRFAAYKAFKCNDLIEQDSQKEPKKQIGKENLIKTFDYWQHTEEIMAGKRARRAKIFDTIKQKGQPRIKWLPSVSIEKRLDHIPYYNQIFSADADVWDKQDIWGCKCSMLGTSMPETDHTYDNGSGKPEPLPELKPSRGVEGNPAKTGEIFTDRANYFKYQPESPKIAGVENSEWLFKEPSKWRMDYFTEDKGVMITERERIKSGLLNDHEKAKFAKEWSMCNVLAANAQKIEFLAERTGEFDILYNGKPADLKKTKSHSHIIEYAEKAINRQGADYVIFEFEVMNDKIRQKLRWLYNNGYSGKVVYYISGINVIHTL